MIFYLYGKPARGWAGCIPASTGLCRVAGGLFKNHGSIMGFIRVNDADGNMHVLEAVEGWRVMEVIREHGLPIEAICGGACACATCHVHVAPSWAGRMHPARDDEEAMLDGVPGAEPTSRLSCQIIWDDHLDGLELTLPGA